MKFENEKKRKIKQKRIKKREKEPEPEMGPNSLGPLAIYCAHQPYSRARLRLCSLTRGAHSPGLPPVRAPLANDWWTPPAEVFFSAELACGRNRTPPHSRHLRHDLLTPRTGLYAGARASHLAYTWVLSASALPPFFPQIREVGSAMARNPGAVAAQAPDRGL